MLLNIHHCYYCCYYYFCCYNYVTTIITHRHPRSTVSPMTPSEAFCTPHVGTGAHMYTTLKQGNAHTRSRDTMTMYTRWWWMLQGAVWWLAGERTGRCWCGTLGWGGSQDTASPHTPKRSWAAPPSASLWRRSTSLVMTGWWVTGWGGWVIGEACFYS